MTAQLFSSQSESANRPAFRISKVAGGYVIRGAEGPPLMIQLTQGLVLALGAGFAAAALVLAVSSEVATVVGPARIGVATLMAGLALLLLWFATRGAVVELHLDLARGELRELVRHRIGKATVVGRHGLSGGATLLVERNGPSSAPCALILKAASEDSGLCIAQGPEAAILELRRRLDSELRGPAAAGLLAA